MFSKNLTLLRYVALFCVLTAITQAHGQFELPNETFERTIFIRHGGDEATAFKFDQGGRIYLVTTRHFTKNLPVGKSVLRRWHNQVWGDLPVIRTFFPSDENVDLAILETEEKIERPYAVVKSSEVLTTGQKVWYMGWGGAVNLPPRPANMPQTLRPIFPEIPMVNLGTISEITPTRPDSFDIHVDRGDGFSPLIAGGPIIYWSAVHRDYEGLGVIKRSDRDVTKVRGVDGQYREFSHSKVLKGYSIDVVSDVIKGNLHN